MPSKRCARCGGFTLIELMVSLAITGIVGIFLAGFLGPQLRIYNALARENSAKSACVGTFNAIQQKVEYARDLTPSGDTLSYTPIFKSGEGTVQQLSGEQLANELFPNIRQNGEEFLVGFQLSDSVLQVTVTVQDPTSGEALYSLTQHIRCLNEEAAG